MYTYIHTGTQEKMEEFNCSNFLLSHPKRTQICSSCLSYASCKKEEGFFLTEGGVGRRKFLFKIKYIKSCCYEKLKCFFFVFVWFVVFFFPRQLLCYLNSNNIFSISNSLFASFFLLYSTCTRYKWKNLIRNKKKK